MKEFKNLSRFFLFLSIFAGILAAENREELKKLVKEILEENSISNRLHQPYLKGMVVTIASNVIDKYFNIYGQGLGDYAGWYICDGRNGAPDLRGKFLVGHDPSSSDYNEIGKAGGHEQVRLTLNELPPHDHTVSLTTSNDGNHNHAFSDVVEKVSSTISNSNTVNIEAGYDTNYILAQGGIPVKGKWYMRNSVTGSSGVHNHYVNGKTDSNGTGSPFDNRPPYFVVTFIVYLG